MRVSSSMIYRQLSLSLREKSDDLSVLETRLSTGKRMTKPSDDPQGSSIAMDYRLSLDKNSVYASNIDRADTQLKFTDTVLSGVEGELTNLIRIIREAPVTSEERMQGLAEIVETSRDQLVGHANSRFNDKYIFSGFFTDRPAFDKGDYNYNGDEGEVRISVGEATEIPLNFNGREVFSFDQTQTSATLDDGTVVTYSQDPASGEVKVSFSDDPTNTFAFSNVMDMTNVLRWALDRKSEDGSALSSDNAMHRIQSLLIPFNNAHAQVMARQSDVAGRLSLASDYKAALKAQASSYRGILSTYEDADPTATAAEALQAKTAFDALNASSAKVLSESIFTLLGQTTA